ncbi:anti-sigma-I factor RsgI family protein [Paenibacillus radicis (ex Gao et al. 2016)]|uniref:Membrane protein n=1 Tax=Paenibacillus radicis (ex Gao et al. 2016) TaxID=1737354 RepID=A0A917M4W4_9BACL|nr:anti-sigma factor domain-containing protein [Paenibacillus radicis (ex Gao et al. 2016)]GGG77144.1 membrane protein [Paenibacillus radicis (ex Gao et al. 2016)]
MNRGVVMQVNGKQAVLMTADGRFVSIPLKEKVQIGEEILFEANTGAGTGVAAHKPRRKRSYWYAGAAAAIILLILPILFFVQSDSHPVVAYVSMDINPSIEIGVDAKKKVWELRALNEDGNKIIENIAFKGKPIEQVADSIMQNIAGAHYLSGSEKDIVITSLLLNPSVGPDFEAALALQVDQAIKRMISQLTLDTKTTITALSIPVELRDEAAINGISSGKMAVYLMAKAEGYAIPIESLKQQSIDKVTEPIGGVNTIVEQSDHTSKEKLKELVDKEKQENAAKKDKGNTVPIPVKPATDGGKQATATITNKPGKPSATPGKSPVRKPETPHKPNKPKEPDKKSDWKEQKDRHKAGGSGKEREGKTRGDHRTWDGHKRDKKDKEVRGSRSGDHDWNTGNGKDKGKQKDKREDQDKGHSRGSGKNGKNSDNERKGKGRQHGNGERVA